MNSFSPSLVFVTANFGDRTEASMAATTANKILSFDNKNHITDLIMMNRTANPRKL